MATPVPDGEASTILVVDDEPLMADLLGEWVAEKWTCETVTTPGDAAPMVDASIDVVLLDRQMPGMSGTEVLHAIRDRDQPGVQVMMVSSVEPDFDIIGLPIDDYLRKPVERPTLQAKIEQLLFRRTYRPVVEQYFVCAAKLDAIERAKGADELADNSAYLSLRSQADELRQQADATLGRMSEHVSEIHHMEADD